MQQNEMPDTTGTKPGDDFSPIETGWYKLKVSKFKTKTNKDDTRWVKIWFKAQGFAGYVWGDVSLNPGRLGKLKMLKDALGIPDAETDMGKIIGGECWGYCFNNDDGFANVNTYAPPSEKEPPSPDSKDDLPF